MNENELYSVAELFKIFGNTSRIRILLALHEKETCVNCLAKELDMSESSVSHQLNILKAHRLIKRRREGKTDILICKTCSPLLIQVWNIYVNIEYMVIRQNHPITFSLYCACKIFRHFRRM